MIALQEQQKGKPTKSKELFADLLILLEIGFLPQISAAERRLANDMKAQMRLFLMVHVSVWIGWPSARIKPSYNTTFKQDPKYWHQIWSTLQV